MNKCEHCGAELTGERFAIFGRPNDPRRYCRACVDGDLPHFFKPEGETIKKKKPIFNF